MEEDESGEIAGVEELECPFCGKGGCLEIVCVGDSAMFQGRTGCGWVSKLCRERDDVRLMWGRRGGKIPAGLLAEVAKRKGIGRVDAKRVERDRKGELEREAERYNPPSEEEMREARGVNRTGHPDEPF